MEIGLAKSIFGKWQKKLMMELKKKVDDGIDFCKKYYVMLQAVSSKMEDNLEVFFTVFVAQMNQSFSFWCWTVSPKVVYSWAFVETVQATWHCCVVILKAFWYNNSSPRQKYVTYMNIPLDHIAPQRTHFLLFSLYLLLVK